MWPLDKFRSDSTDDRPAKPDDGTERKESKFPRYEATVHYRNGDTETFECYGIYKRVDSRVVFNMSPKVRVSLSNNLGHTFTNRAINYETLEREPVLEKLTTDTFIITADVTHEWRRQMGARYGSKKWRPEYENATLEIDHGDD